jgi:hypothetical protein
MANKSIPEEYFNDVIYDSDDMETINARIRALEGFESDAGSSDEGDQIDLDPEEDPEDPEESDNDDLEVDSEEGSDSEDLSEEIDSDVDVDIIEDFGDEILLNLVPGNWFELKTYSLEKSEPFNKVRFEAYLRQHIETWHDKIAHIQGVANVDVPIKNIEFCLTDEKMFKISEMLQNEKRHPLITFHGTNSQNIAPITKGGYLIAGVDNVKRAHGAARGVGVYSSPHLSVAAGYASGNTRKIIVNFVLIGKPKLVADIEANVARDDKTKAYKDGTTTRILYGITMLISSDSERIIPVAVLTL